MCVGKWLLWLWSFIWMLWKPPNKSEFLKMIAADLGVAVDNGETLGHRSTEVFWLLPALVQGWWVTSWWWEAWVAHSSQPRSHFVHRGSGGSCLPRCPYPYSRTLMVQCFLGHGYSPWQRESRLQRTCRLRVWTRHGGGVPLDCRESIRRWWRGVQSY